MADSGKEILSIELYVAELSRCRSSRGVGERAVPTSTSTPMGVCITLARLLCLSTLAAASSRDCSLINVNDTLVSTCELQTPSSECATLSAEVAALSAKVQEHIASTAALHEKLDQLLLALNPPVPPSSPPLPPSPPPFHTSCTTVPASGVHGAAPCEPWCMRNVD